MAWKCTGSIHCNYTVDLYTANTLLIFIFSRLSSKWIVLQGNKSFEKSLVFTHRINTILKISCHYNLFDERESRSSQILCSYLMTRSRLRHDTKNLAIPIAPCYFTMDVGHFSLTKCLYPQYVPSVPGRSPGPHLQSLKFWNVSIHLWVPQHPYKIIIT